MKTALLIVNYNDANTTMDLINNVRDFESLDYVLVVDNKSNDNSYTNLLAYKNDFIDIIQTSKNGGYGYAINYGIKHLVKLFGELNVIVSNSDIIIDNNQVIENLIKSKNHEYAIVAPSIKEDGNLSRGWKLPSPIVDVGMNIAYFHRYVKQKFMYYPESYYQNKTSVDVDVILGCFFLIDSQKLREVNYFDENVFLYGEENIIGKKLKDAGYKTKVLVNTFVTHNHSISIDKSINKLNKYKQLKKSQYYFQKNYNKANKAELGLYKTVETLTLGIFKVYYKVKK